MWRGFAFELSVRAPRASREAAHMQSNDTYMYTCGMKLNRILLYTYIINSHYFHPPCRRNEQDPRHPRYAFLILYIFIGVAVVFVIIYSTHHTMNANTG